MYAICLFICWDLDLDQLYTYTGHCFLFYSLLSYSFSWHFYPKQLWPDLNQKPLDLQSNALLPNNTIPNIQYTHTVCVIILEFVKVLYVIHVSFACSNWERNRVVQMWGWHLIHRTYTSTLIQHAYFSWAKVSVALKGSSFVSLIVIWLAVYY